MAGIERRRRRIRRSEPANRAPSPHDLAELGTTFAQTAGVHDPEEVPEPEVDQHTEQQTERGLRGLVGGGSSQVSVTAAMRARDAARPSDAELAAVEADLVIVRRGWVPREDLPRGGGRR